MGSLGAQGCTELRNPCQHATNSVDSVFKKLQSQWLFWLTPTSKESEWRGDMRLKGLLRLFAGFQATFGTWPKSIKIGALRPAITAGLRHIRTRTPSLFNVLKPLLVLADGVHTLGPAAKKKRME